MQLVQKGQTLQLKSKAGGSLTMVAVGLGWGKKEKKGLLGPKKVSVDLDASCIMYDGSRNAVDTIWWRNLRSNDGSVVHTGDDLVGGGNEQDPNEVINVDLRLFGIGNKGVRIVAQAADAHSPGSHEIVDLRGIRLLEIGDVDVCNACIPTCCFAFRPTHQLYAGKVLFRCKVDNLPQ